MSMLNFKYGLHDNLPEYSPLTQGTVFVTADEQAMYIDLPEIQKDGKTVGGRIRVSQIITLSGIAEWQTLTPPYNTESFYYLIDANALLKCNEIDGQYQWTQINSTSDLQTSVENLAKLIGDENSGLTKSVADNAAAIAELKAFQTAQATKDKTQDEAISALVAKDGVIEDDLKDLGQVIGYIGEFTDASEIANANEDDVAIIGGAIKKFDGTNWQDYGDLVDEIEKLRALYNELKASTPTSTTFAELTTKVDNLEKWQTETVTPTLTDYGTRIEAAEGQIEDILGTIGNEENGLIADIAEAAAKGQQGIDDAAAAQTDATKALADAKLANDTIGDVNGGLVKDIADNKQAAANADKKAQDVTDAVNNATTGLAAAHAAAKAADDKAEQGVTDAATADAKGQSALDKIGDASNGLVKDIADNAAAAKAADNAAKAADTKAQNAQKDLDALELVVGNSESGLVKSVNQNISDIAQLEVDLGAETEAREKAIDDLKTELLSDIQTADAMKFISTVDSVDDLPIVGDDVAIGHTYKAIAEFDAGATGVVIEYANENDQVIHIGDLLIAQGTESSGRITSDLKWLQVPSGYVADYNPELKAETVDNGAIINLTSGAYKDGSNLTQSVAAGDLGQITLRGDTDSAVKITASANEVTIGMAWGTFGEI